MLEDPTVEEATKETYRIQSNLFRAYFTEALGGIYRSNLDGIPSYRHIRESSARRSRYRKLIRRDSRAIRNDVNVSISLHDTAYLTIPTGFYT